MQIDALPIAGAYVVTPRQFPDDRGVFLEGFRADHLAEQHRPSSHLRTARPATPVRVTT